MQNSRSNIIRYIFLFLYTPYRNYCIREPSLKHTESHFYSHGRQLCVTNANGYRVITFGRLVRWWSWRRKCVPEVRLASRRFLIYVSPLVASEMSLSRSVSSPFVFCILFSTASSTLAFNEPICYLFYCTVWQIARKSAHF